jgi:hypothetical protein
MVDLLGLSSSDQLLLTQKFYFYKTSCLNKEVNRPELIPSLRVPCYTASKLTGIKDIKEISRHIS